MAIHDNVVSMLREALPEYLTLARMGISHRKANGGALGYPSATSLFAVVDAIGSYHRGDPKFTVQVDGKAVTIDRTGDHILILNSAYFGFDLTGDALREIYRLNRSPLTHNAVVGDGQRLWVGEPVRPAIESKADGIHVYLPGFLERCEKAVEQFLAVADTVVPKSLAVEELNAKAARSHDDEVKAWPGGITATAQVTGMGRLPDRLRSRR